MFVLRLVIVLVGFAIGAGILAYLFTGDRRYLAQSWKITRYALIMVAVVLALMFLERVVGMV